MGMRCARVEQVVIFEVIMVDAIKVRCWGDAGVVLVRGFGFDN